MILTTHALTGAALGKNIENTSLIIILSIVLHFFLDSFRHGEYFDSRSAKFKNTFWKIGLDIAIGFSIIFSIFLFQDWNQTITKNILIGMFFSMLPDGLTLLFYFGLKSWPFDKIKQFHSFCHRYSKWPKYGKERQWNFPNALNDIIFSILAITILFIF